MSGWKIPLPVERFLAFQRVCGLAGGTGLFSRAKRRQHGVYCVSQASKTFRLQREVVVCALPGTVVREVVLEDAAAESERRQRGRPVRRVRREAGDGVRKAFAKAFDHPKVENVVRRRIDARALQQRERRAGGNERLEDAVDVCDFAAASGEDHGSTEPRNVLNEWRVRGVAGCDLECRNVEPRQHICAAVVERG